MGHAEGYFWCGPCPQQTSIHQSSVLMYTFIPSLLWHPVFHCCSEQGKGIDVGSRKPLLSTYEMPAVMLDSRDAMEDNNGYDLHPRGAGRSICIPNPSFPGRSRPSCESWRGGSALPLMAKETEALTTSPPPSSQEPSLQIASVQSVESQGNVPKSPW